MIAIAVAPTATATASAAALGLVALAAFGGWLVVAMSLLGKYAFYDEGADRSRLVGLIAAFTLLTFFFPPMTFIGLALLWRRALASSRSSSRERTSQRSPRASSALCTSSGWSSSTSC